MVDNHTRDKQIGLPLRGRPILLSLLLTLLIIIQNFYDLLQLSLVLNTERLVT